MGVHQIFNLILCVNLYKVNIEQLTTFINPPYSHYAPPYLVRWETEKRLQCPPNIVIEQDLDSCQDRGIPPVN